MSYGKWIPSVLWAALILVLTSIPVPENLTTAAPAGSDKIVHFGLYAVLGFLLTTAMSRPDALWRGATTAILVIAVFAVVDELHQHFIPGRFASLIDWVADVAGAATGAALAALRMTRREWQQ